MLLEANELSEILRKEQEYIDDLKRRWDTNDLSESAEHDLRMGKRTELLGDLQAVKSPRLRGATTGANTNCL